MHIGKGRYVVDWDRIRWCRTISNNVITSTGITSTEIASNGIPMLVPN